MPEFYDFYQRDDSGNPIVTSYHRVTDGESNAMRGGNLYMAIPITRSAIMKSGRMGDNEAEITFSITNDFAKSRLLRRTEPRYWVSIWVSANATQSFWRGKMKMIRPTRNTIQMTFTALLGALRIYGLPANYQTTCRHSLYDDLCKVKKQTGMPPAVTHSNSREIMITKIDGRRQLIEVTDPNKAPPANWDLSEIEHGYLEQGGVNFRIVAISGSIIYLTRTTGLKVAAAIVFRGCDKRFSTCKDRFNNLENFGGFPYLSPYEYWGQNLTTLPEIEKEE